MTSFAALMALSATQTRQSEEQVQSQLAERKRREAGKRKQIEEKERREREIEQKLRVKALEEAQRAKEREQQFEAAKRAKEAALKKKEGEQRDALRYGPNKRSYPSSSSAARDELRRRRMPNSDDEAGGAALTREEKRQMRLQRELNYGASTSRRSAGGYRKTGRRLAGGAVDVDATAGGSGTAGQYRSVKERLAHEPPGLIKLNVNKRDTRTIDEILQDRAKAKNKTLAGDEAKQFDDWFGKSKPKAGSTAPPSPPSSIFSSRSNSPVRAATSEGKAASNAVSRASKSLSGTPPVTTQASAASSKLSAPAYTSKAAASVLPSKGSGVQVKSVGGSRPADKSSANGLPTPKPANGKVLAVKTGVSSSKALLSAARAGASAASKQAGPSSSKLASSSASFKKRPRSPSFSPSPPPAKRRSAPPGGGSSISAEIWKIFGKDRNTYVGRDVFSDDEDMEAGARDLESEELYRSVLRLYLWFMDCAMLTTHVQCQDCPSRGRACTGGREAPRGGEAQEEERKGDEGEEGWYLMGTLRLCAHDHHHTACSTFMNFP